MNELSNNSFLESMDFSWLPWSALMTSVLIVALIVFWKARYLPFTGRKSPPTYLLVWVLLLASLVMFPGLLQWQAEQVTPWWALWLALLLAGVVAITLSCFQRAKTCFPTWLNTCIFLLCALYLALASLAI